MRALLTCLVLALIPQPVCADRAAYSGSRDIETRAGTLIVRHHHDWSRLQATDGGARLRYSAAMPFGVDEQTARLEFQSSPDAPVIRVSSPPLTHLELSADGRYVIGLSNIKYLNSTQLVVFSAAGELLLRRAISSSVYCLDTAQYQNLRSRHPQGFDALEQSTRTSLSSLGWRDGDQVYLDINVSPGGPHWGALRKDLLPATCHSPLSAHFSESVTNVIHWYHQAEPRPRVVERDGRPFEVRLRDPKGIEFAIPFEPTPLGTR